MQRNLILTILVLFLTSTATSVLAQREVAGDAGGSSLIKSSRTGLVLYDQLNPSGGYIVSQDFRDAASIPLSSEAADDFVVPGGDTWSIGAVGVQGYFWADSPGGAMELNIFIYSDDAGMPGDTLHSYESYTNFSTLVDSVNGYMHTYYEIYFPTPISLSSGTYWLGVQVVGDYDIIGQWGWEQAANEPWINEQFHWRNPDDGFGNGYTTWTPADIVLMFGYRDCSFIIFDEPFADDLSAQALVGPQSSPGLTAAETITMNIKNEGSNVQTGFDVSYTIDGGTTVTENVGSLTIDPENTADYSFTTTADLSVTGIYDIVLTTDLSGDQYMMNDTVTDQIINYGTVYPMEDGVDIYACSGTFTDSGGLDSNFTKSEILTMTIYPETPGSQVRLNFVEFDVYWSEFYIYDGEDTDAPLIGFYESTFSPGIVDALNTAGALTIHFEGVGWGDATSGWAALISCFTLPTDDFAIMDFSITPATVFTEQYFTLSTTVRNIGAVTQAKDVSFHMDGNLIGTVTTDVITLGEYATVEFTTSLSVAGDHNTETTIPADNGDDPANNAAEIDFYAYPEDSFVEFFENPEFPPSFWSVQENSSWMRADVYPYEGQGYATSYNGMFFVGDTLFTPQLSISTGDTLEFYAKSSLWWLCEKFIVAYQDVNTGIWTPLDTFSLDFNFYLKYEIDLTPAAGNNYLAFINYYDNWWYWGSEVFLDHVIGRGVSLYFVNDDLAAYNLQGTTTPSVNEPTPITVTVRNVGQLDKAQGSYTVKLMQADENGDIVLATKNGQLIEHLQELDYTFNYTFNASGEYDIYAVVDLPGDQQPENDTTVGMHMHVQVSGTVKVPVGQGDDESYWLPMRTGGGNSLTQTIYPASMLTQTGALTGLSYYYNNNSYADVLNVPVEIWIGNTTQSVTTDGWIPSTELTKVYQDTVDFLMGEHEIYLPFGEPINYQGGNLASLVYKGFQEGWTTVYFKNTPYTDSISNWSQSYDTLLPQYPDTNNTPHPVPEIPNTTFFVNTACFGELGGTAYDENGGLFEGVKVAFDNYTIDTLTDVNGAYFFNEILAGTSSVTASYWEYDDVTHSINLQSGMYNTLDFQMYPKPLVNVSGVVVGNDSPTNYLEGAEIALTGYFNFIHSSGPDGEFSIPAVYGNETYTMTVSLYGYETYVDHNVVVEGQNLNLGTIVLNELMSIAFAVDGEEGYDEVTVNWSVPNTGADHSYNYYIDATNGYANDPYEHVWLGNEYKTGTAGTITTVDMYWRDYGLISDYVSLDILDQDGNVVMSSEAFMTEKEEWVTVDIPDVAFEGVFYAMVHWKDNQYTTDFLAIEENENGQPEDYYARIMYPGQPVEPLSSVTGKEGTFEMIVNTVIENEPKALNGGSRYVESYNIYKGLLSDVPNSSSWSALNSAPITETIYVDEDWPPVELDEYVYAIEAIFTTGSSVFSYSNPVYNVAPEFVSEPITSTLVTSLYEYEVEVDDLNADDIISITADLLPDWLTLTDNGDGTALLSGTSTEIGLYDVVLRASDGQLADTQEFTISADPVGIDEMADNTLRIYPNPVTDNLYIEYNGTADAVIYNMFGQAVGTYDLGNQTNNINIENLNSGVYVIRIIDGDFTSTHKFTKK